jgi:hypothetical protein
MESYVYFSFLQYGRPHPQKLNQFFAQKQGLVLDCIFEREKHQMVGGICLDVVAGELIVTTHT